MTSRNDTRIASRSSDPVARSHRMRSACGRVFPVTVERLIVLTSLFWALSANRLFLSGALRDHDFSQISSWGFAVAMLVVIVSIHVLMLAFVANRWTVKPLLASATIVTALVSYYAGSYGVFLDPAMVRNVLRTDLVETRELLTPALAVHMLIYAALPIWLLWRVRIVNRTWRRAAAFRFGLVVVAATALSVALVSVFQPFASLMRRNTALRYLVTPANVLWSAGVVAVADASGAARPREAIGLDAAPGESWAARRKPLVVVLVVGETARAANWGLNGYARRTTPQLATLPVINFPDVYACGTSTEVSLPCMFAPVGRRKYDEERIRSQQSLLHVAARAGVGVLWRDNQSGCKGVCDGLPQETVSAAMAPGLCDGGRCLDDGLVAGLDQRLASARGTQLWVLHMLGSHGPSYFRRYPPEYAHFGPDCRDDDLRNCSVAQIMNAYDNSLLYTDHVLAALIAKLRAHQADVDAALIYVSDHGESLGERGLFLHGIPHAIAPDVQTRVPMIFWASDGFERGAGLAAGCLVPELRRRSATPVAHDHLFHTVLGLLDVHTALHEPAWDLVAACRSAGSDDAP